MENNPKENEKLTSYRWKLASRITLYSIIGIALVAVVAIIFSDDRPQTAQMVFTATVPLLASWVGTVLAYYYSSESLDAATRSVKDLRPTEEKLMAIAVSKVMLKLADITKFSYDDTQEVKAILDELKNSGKGERLPFLDSENRPVYLLHKSAINNALVDNALAPDGLTFQQLFEKAPDLKVLAMGSFATLEQDATLENARAEMNRIANCQDVFITENGTKNSPVVGWITNGIIEENSKL
jgi:hypothetical protein